jgi:hypothetical protein
MFTLMDTINTKTIKEFMHERERWEGNRYSPIIMFQNRKVDSVIIHRDSPHNVRLNYNRMKHLNLNLMTIC